MDLSFGSGDNGINNKSQPVSPRCNNSRTDDQKVKEEPSKDVEIGAQEMPLNPENVTPQTIENHETKLKDRIAQCRNIIETLKLELNEEKAKLEKDAQSQSSQFVPRAVDDSAKYTSSWTPDTDYYNVSTSNDIMGDLALAADMYSACVDSKLNCDENLMEYEKQLEKYQTTLNMAQIEKKNAIRKQMLTKAYKLKLLELENQCNIELLRVKQSLQCLEPLQMIASKWKIGSDEGSYDLDKFELMPAYPEITSSVVEVQAVQDESPEPVSTEAFD